MITAAFYERRNGSVAIHFKDRRIAPRRIQLKAFSPERRNLTSPERFQERGASAVAVPIGINFELSHEQKALQVKAREFAQREIAPVAAHHDRTAEFPWDVLKKAFDEGFFTDYIPKKYGGSGLGILETAVITEELAACCVGITTSIMINVLGVGPLLLAGTEQQKKKYLIPYCQQLNLWSFAFTEPDAGSDPSRIATLAERKGDHYILNGMKHFITNGGVADYYTVFATIDRGLGTKGMTAFVVPSKMEGVRNGKALDKMGQRASNTSEIFFKDVKVPVENRIGGEGEGYKIALMSISRSRINVAAGAVGIARTAMEHALRHAQKRIQFNQPLANFQYVQFRLADMATQIDAARSLAWKAAWAHDHGHRFSKESSMAKDFAGDVVMKVTSEALDLLGGYGYSKAYPLEKLMRDAKLMQIYEGPSPIHKTIIYRELAKEHGY
jgi:acyl-CoA dehydrogenase